VERDRTPGPTESRRINHANEDLPVFFTAAHARSFFQCQNAKHFKNSVCVHFTHRANANQTTFHAM